MLGSLCPRFSSVLIRKSLSEKLKLYRVFVPNFFWTQAEYCILMIDIYTYAVLPRLTDPSRLCCSVIVHCRLISIVPITERNWPNTYTFSFWSSFPHSFALYWPDINAALALAAANLPALDINILSSSKINKGSDSACFSISFIIIFYYLYL